MILYISPIPIGGASIGMEHQWIWIAIELAINILHAHFM